MGLSFYIGVIWAEEDDEGGSVGTYSLPPGSQPRGWGGLILVFSS